MATIAFIRPELAEHQEAIMSQPEITAQPKAWPAPLGRPPSIESRHPNELSIDDSYQRSIESSASQRLIRKIAQGWDWRMCLPLVVSIRDDGLFIIDGQHRWAAAKMRGDISWLPIWAARYESVADEAAMFVAMNRSRRAINRLDDFHAASSSGDELALEIRTLVTGAGFTVARRTGSQTWNPGEVAFTTSIRNVLRKHGPKVCADALKLMAEAFPDEVLTAGAPVFSALTKIILSGEVPDRDRLFRALLTYDQKGWASFVIGIRRGGEDKAFAMRKALLMAYEDAK